VPPEVHPDDPPLVGVARRAQLVRCTIDAIADVGYQRASVAEIAMRAGISKGAVLDHFADRDELIEAAFTEALTSGTNHLMPRVQAATTPREQLRAYVNGFIEALDVDPKAIQVLFTIGRHLTDEYGRPRFLGDHALQETALATLEDILRRGQSSGEFGEFGIRSMAMMMRATLEEIPTYVIAYPGLDLAGYGRDLITFFERACGVRPPARP
jgi:TetR/AcrR family fatty acid metabolism transcriptional regulator